MGKPVPCQAPWPNGYWCSRGQHTGPCALRPYPMVSTVKVGPATWAQRIAVCVAVTVIAVLALIVAAIILSVALWCLIAMGQTIGEQLS